MAKKARCECIGTIEGGGYEKMFEEIRRVYSPEGISPTVTAKKGSHHEVKTMVDARIRKLTPLEAWRLMNFDDSDYYKARSVESNTQLYAQAGNSIVVNCLVAIFGQMFEGKEHIYEK